MIPRTRWSTDVGTPAIKKWPREPAGTIGTVARTAGAGALLIGFAIGANGVHDGSLTLASVSASRGPAVADKCTDNPADPTCPPVGPADAKCASAAWRFTASCVGGPFDPNNVSNCTPIMPGCPGFVPYTTPPTPTTIQPPPTETGREPPPPPHHHEPGPPPGTDHPGPGGPPPGNDHPGPGEPPPPGADHPEPGTPHTQEPAQPPPAVAVPPVEPLAPPPAIEAPHAPDAPAPAIQAPVAPAPVMAPAPVAPAAPPAVMAPAPAPAPAPSTK